MGYTSRPASYFEAVKGWEKRRNNWDVDTSLMSWCPGVVPALSVIVKLFSEDGDKVMIQTPVYSEFYDVTEAWGREVVENKLVEENGKWHVDFEDFEKKAKEVKIFLLCSPHNPLGIVWSREELERMARICIDNDVLLVSDEIHSDLIFHGKKHLPTASISEELAGKVISCVSATKTFNLAGLQASTTIFPNLEHPQKLHLHGLAHALHLVQKQRPAVGELEQARAAPLLRARERPLLVAEQLALRQILRHGRHVDGQDVYKRQLISLPLPILILGTVFQTIAVVGARRLFQ